ncbi:hypothetical protein QA601_11285 [Chitinispirillales bacterium ANBcel5]|uniref:hypothetical protein n=1 Tax=Cellulosispirillum alkaliphilum TaxID=3039283 RepID=UPI002A538B66|nr:hypothetical protein [Chitinispirillales bacterium ANBcel5]
MSAQESIAQGISMAIRHPESGVVLLARTFANSFKGAPWITREMKLKFCILFLGNIIDKNIEKSIDRDLAEKVLGKSIHFGIRLLKREPERGLRMLVALIMRELRERQKYSEDELQRFYDEVIVVFFPDAPAL